MSMYVEILGYVGSLIILISLTMKSIVKLRWINAVGSLLFVFFAVLTNSAPTVVMNLGIIFIDLWYVYKISKNKAVYKMIKAEPKSAFLEFFYESYKNEIDAIFGDRAINEAKDISYFVCNGEIAGLFAWSESTSKECQILIDFVTPQYRDTKIGMYFFDQQLHEFREKGFVRLKYINVGASHWKYLTKIGFTETQIGSFEKEL